MGTGTPTDAGGEYVERARRLAPQIEDCADQIEQERRLVGSVLDALFEAGMFRLLLPRSLDGAEVDPATFAQVIEEIAKAVFGRYRRAVLAWGPGPDSRAVTQQLQGRQAHFETVGQFLLGHELDTTFL
jgi:alkylation response protein AidB-like acyl-CoA dehydrogenase